MHCFILGLTDGHIYSPVFKCTISIVSYMSIISSYINIVSVSTKIFFHLECLQKPKPREGGAVAPWASQTTFSRKIKYMLHACCTPFMNPYKSLSQMLYQHCFKSKVPGSSTSGCHTGQNSFNTSWKTIY